MQEAYLYRSTTSDEGTFGVLLFEGDFWYSIELPHRDNKPNYSCIPEGEYVCKLRYSPSFRKTYYCLQNVKDRSYILIHGANFAGDRKKGFVSHLSGCIALGKKVGTMMNKYKKKQKCVMNSQVALREFMDATNDEEFKLIIKDFTC